MNSSGVSLTASEFTHTGVSRSTESFIRLHPLVTSVGFEPYIKIKSSEPTGPTLRELRWSQALKKGQILISSRPVGSAIRLSQFSGRRPTLHRVVAAIGAYCFLLCPIGTTTLDKCVLHLTNSSAVRLLLG